MARVAGGWGSSSRIRLYSTDWFLQTCTVCFLYHLLFEKTWPILGVGDGQGCRGEGVGQGAGAGSIDSIDHQKPGPESCWRERGGNGVWCYLEWELRLEEGNKDGRYWNEDGRCGIVMEKVS